MVVRKKIDFQSEEYRLGQNIQRIRKLRGYSQTQLAELMDMDRAAISNYENGSKGEMGFKTLHKFARALGTTTSELLGEKKEESEVFDMLDEENKQMLLKMAEALLLKQQLTA